MCPLPDVSSARTTLPAGSRRTLPSLVSNSTSPESQRTSKRCGGLCQCTSPIPEGTWQMLHHEVGKLCESRSGGLSSKSFRGWKAISKSSMWVSPFASAKIRRHITRLSLCRRSFVPAIDIPLGDFAPFGTCRARHQGDLRRKGDKLNRPMCREPHSQGCDPAMADPQ